MMPLLLEMWRAVICHGVSIWCCNSSVAKEKWMKRLTFVWQKESPVFVRPLFYSFPVEILQEFSSSQYSRSKQDQKMMCGLLIWKRSAWLSSNVTVFLRASKKGKRGDSSFDHVPLDSPTVPRLAGMHQNTFTIHCHGKTGDVVLQWAMKGRSILMHPKISLFHESVILDVSPFPNSSFFSFFWWY
jgi:hypothetical protein